MWLPWVPACAGTTLRRIRRRSDRLQLPFLGSRDEATARGTAVAPAGAHYLKRRPARTVTLKA
jgi:hypothetical protein